MPSRNGIVGNSAGYARMTGGTKESDWDKCSRMTEPRFRHIAHRKAVQCNQLKNYHFQSEDWLQQPPGPDSPDLPSATRNWRIAWSQALLNISPDRKTRQGTVPWQEAQEFHKAHGS